MNMLKKLFLVASALAPVLTPLSAAEILFDAQATDPVSSFGTTAPGAVAWNAVSGTPVTFNTFYPVSSASITESGITAEISPLLGTWPGNSTSAISGRPLESDYFIVGTGTTAVLTLTGLVPAGQYKVTIYHGRAEPQQLRQLTLSANGQLYGTIDNQSAGGSGNVQSLTLNANASGELAIDLLAGGAEGDFAGFSIEEQVPMWGGLVISPSGTVDTGAPIGVLFVNQAPWVYSYTLAAWLYSPDSDPGNIWFHVP